MTVWRMSSCGYDNKPTEWDTTSSPTTVYQRRNIEEVTVPPMMEGEEEIKMWRYEERTFTREEYNLVMATNETLLSSINFKHDNDIIDEYTMTLLEEGLL